MSSSGPEDVDDVGQGGAEPGGRRALDFTPLTGPVGLLPRLREGARNNLMVYSITLGVVLTVGPLVVLAALVAAGSLSGGGVAMILFLLTCGVIVLVTMLILLGSAAALRAFAVANDLEWVGGTTVEHYAAERFANGSTMVQQGVRTRALPQLEVGDRYPTASPGSANDPNQLELYLRVRLDAPIVPPADGADLLTPELRSRLEELAGRFTIEVDRDEVTLFGTRGLKVRKRGRVEEALDLAEALAVRAQDVFELARPGSAQAAQAAETASGIPIPVLGPTGSTPGRTMSPWRVVVLLLAFLTIGPILIALVFSTAESTLNGNAWGVRLLLGVVLVVVIGVVSALVRKMITPTSGGTPPDPDRDR